MRNPVPLGLVRVEGEIREKRETRERRENPGALHLVLGADACT